MRISKMDKNTLININYSFANQSSNEKWTQQLKFLKELSLRDDLYITINSNYDIGKFANDNNEHLLSFMNQQFKISQANDCPLEDLIFSVVVRQFTNIKNNKNIPQKRVAICVLKQDGIYPVSKEQTISACTTCHKTGKLLKPEKGVTYIGFQKMLEYLGINI